MIPRPARDILWVVSGLFVCLLLTAWFLPGGLELRIIPARGGDPLAVLPLKAGERFTIQYWHSVEETPIWEKHSLDRDGRIYIEEERYLRFGAGMGRMPGIGRMVKRGPYEVIEAMHFPTGDFILRIGSPGVDHTLIWRGTRTNLSDLAPHEAVRFSARPVSLMYKAFRWVFPHPATPNAHGKGLAGPGDENRSPCKHGNSAFSASTTELRASQPGIPLQGGALNGFAG